MKKPGTTRKTTHTTASPINLNDSEPTMSTSTTIASSATSVSPAPSAPAATPLFQKPPPPNALIPTPPNGFIPSGNAFLGVIPRLTELDALSGAVDDLNAFVDYATVLGATAPPYDEIIAAFTLADQWSTMRKASLLWDKFAQLQEGIAWTTLRPLMEKLTPAFALATTHNASLPTRFANLTTLLNAKKAIARKGVSTRALNKQAIANGKPPTHGKVGRQRKKAADKAIVAAAGSGTAPSGVVAPNPPTPPTAPTLAPTTEPATPATTSTTPVHP